jgi:hypothetical protein
LFGSAEKLLRARWALASGVLIAFLTYVLAFFLIDVCLIVYSITIRGEQYDQSVLNRLALIMEAWGSPVLYLLLTAGATAWMARRFGARHLGYGVLVGVISAASGSSNQAVRSSWRANRRGGRLWWWICP